jgi:hypothetical protein
MKGILTFLVFVVLGGFVPVMADSLAGSAVRSEEELAKQISERSEYLNFIREELKTINEEIAKCNKDRNKWKTATILGGVGIGLTGGAIVAQKVSHNKEVKANQAKQEAQNPKKEEEEKKE